MRPGLLQQQPGALAAAAALATFEHWGTEWALAAGAGCLDSSCSPRPSQSRNHPTDPLQAAFCDVPTPSTWPALMQAPRMALYQGAEPPVVTALYTGARLPGC